MIMQKCWWKVSLSMMPASPQNTCTQWREFLSCTWLYSFPDPCICAWWWMRYSSDLVGVCTLQTAIDCQSLTTEYIGCGTTTATYHCDKVNLNTTTHPPTRPLTHSPMHTFTHPLTHPNLILVWNKMRPGWKLCWCDNLCSICHARLELANNMSLQTTVILLAFNGG